MTRTRPSVLMHDMGILPWLFLLLCYHPAASEVSVAVRRGSADSTWGVQYQVVNTHRLPVIALLIGYDPDGDSGQFTGPIPDTVESPEGWQSLVVTEEEELAYYVRWEVINRTSSIAPGDSLSCFLITLPAHQTEFTTCAYVTITEGHEKTTGDVILIDSIGRKCDSQ